MKAAKKNEIKPDIPVLKPLYDKVIIRRDKTVQQPQSLIFIPETVQEKINQGTVIAVGEGKMSDEGVFKELQTKPGDRVLFGKYNGFEVVFNGEELLVMREEEIFALIKE
jgi:chaperonin GroES